MDILKQTKQLCDLYHIKPARSRGQNFLIKEDVYDKIIAVAELKKSDIVLEVGPGLGFLTARLAARAKKVIAVELDDKLAEVSRIGLKAWGIRNVEVINENILGLSILNNKLENKDFKNKTHNSLFIIHDSYKIVANLPYNITSIFLRKFLSAKHKPELMVLMLQKEVAERIVAKPGKMSLLAVSVQYFARPEIMRIVPADNFWPKPEVDSAIVRIIPHPVPPLREGRGQKISLLMKPACRQGREGVGGGEKEFFHLVKIGFSAKRKMLKNNLASGYHLSHLQAEEKITKAGFSPKIRAQELSIEDWQVLLNYFYPVKRKPLIKLDVNPIRKVF